MEQSALKPHGFYVIIKNTAIMEITHSKIRNLLKQLNTVTYFCMADHFENGCYDTHMVFVSYKPIAVKRVMEHFGHCLVTPLYHAYEMEPALELVLETERMKEAEETCTIVVGTCEECYYPETNFELYFNDTREKHYRKKTCNNRTCRKSPLV